MIPLGCNGTTISIRQTIKSNNIKRNTHKVNKNKNDIKQMKRLISLKNLTWEQLNLLLSVARTGTSKGPTFKLYHTQ